MSKEIQFHIKGDTATQYLNIITDKAYNQSDAHLKKMAKILTGYDGIEQHMSHRFNKNLYKSGKDPRTWKITKTFGEGVSLIATYTGMTHRRHSSDFRTWIEFSDEFIEKGADWSAYMYVKEYYSQRELHLNRDYAFYQETGLDEYADKDDAKYTEYVEKGVEDTYKQIINKSAGYIKNIMANRR